MLISQLTRSLLLRRKDSLRSARAMSLTTATNQGAQFGTGLQGAYGETSGEYNTQGVAIGQNLQIGQNLFGINANISADKIALAQAQGQSAIGSGLSSLGGALVSSAGLFGKIGASFSGGSSSITPSYEGGGVHT